MKKYTVGAKEIIEWEWHNIEAESADEAVQIAQDNWTDAKIASAEVDDKDYLVKLSGKSWDEGTLYRESK